MATSYNLVPHYHVVFRDEDGTPLIGGSVYFFKDTDHVTPKDVYEDKDGSIPLPNPVELNDAGVIADDTGAAKPIYYADDEYYYIEVYRIGEGPGDTPIQTIEHFNSPLLDFPTPSIESTNLTNYILNPQYRFYVEQSFANTDLPAATEVSIAEEGWFFYRDTANSTNSISFEEFAAGQTDVPYNPKHYLYFQCSIAGTETRKDFVFPVEDAISFSNNRISFGIWARSASGSPTTLQLVLRQNFGAGGSSTVETIIDTYTVTTSWDQYSTLNFLVRSVAGKTIGTDDRLEIIVRTPLNQICQIEWTNLQWNISAVLYDFNYTSSEMESIQKKAYDLPDTEDANYGYAMVSEGDRNVYRDDTGKIEQWLFGDQPAYTLLMDGTTYVRLDYVTGTNNKVRYNRLYQKWDNDSVLANGNAFGYGEDGFFPLNYSNIAIFTNTKAAAVTDWSDNDTGFSFSTLQQFGAIGFSVAFKPINQLYSLDTIRITNTANGDVTDTAAGTSGFTVTKVQDGDGSNPEISDIQTIAAGSLNGKYFLVSSTTTDYYVWFKEDGTGVDPAVGGRTGIAVELLSTDSAVYVAKRIKDALNGHEITKITCNAASTLSGGEYFNAYSTSTPFYVWYTVDGVGTDPAPGGKTGILVEVDGTDTNAEVAQKTTKAISSYYFVVPDMRGYFARAWANGSDNDPDRASRVGFNDNIISGDKVGTIQTDEFRSHNHTVNAHCSSGEQDSPCNHYPGKDVAGAPWEASYTGLMATDMINNSGGNESRGLNINLLFTIKY